MYKTDTVSIKVELEIVWTLPNAHVALPFVSS